MRAATPREVAIATVRGYYGVFNSGDRAALLALLADDVVHDVNEGGREVGREAFRAFLARMDRCYRERLEDLVVMASDDGRRAAAECTTHGTSLVADDGLPSAQGQRQLLPAGAFLALDPEGRITRVTTHHDVYDWIAQVS